MSFDIMTLEAGGEEKSFTEWGFDWQSAVQEINNQSVGTFHVARPGANITDDPIFEVEDWVIVRSGRVAGEGGFSGGRIEFQGRMIKVILESSADLDVVTYEFQDPWYDIENTPYQQPVQGYVGTPTAVEEVSTSEVMLFAQYTTGGWVSTNIGDMATAVLQYLLDVYDDLGEDPPYQIGTIDITAPRNSYQTRDQKCGEILRMCLTGAPDANVWFDYTFSPPKLNITSRANLTPVTLGFADGTDQKQVRIIPRYDLIPASIVIWFKLIGSLDGGTIINYVKDKFPADGPEKGRNVVIQTVDMQGTQQTTVNGSLEVLAVGANSGTFATKRAWWARHLPEFASSKIRFPSGWSVAGISNATITDEAGSAVSLGDFPYELLDGSNVCPWMAVGGAPVVAKRVTITAQASYDEYDVAASVGDNSTNGNKLNRYVDRQISVQVSLTNGITGNYSALQSSIASEPVPLGMAQGMFEACEELQYECNDLRVDPSVRVELGNAVNFGGGRTEWETMNAQPQTIRRQFGQGYVELSIGPAKHLSAAELTQMFLVNRYRRHLFDPGSRATGGSSSGSVALGKNSPRNNSNKAGPQLEFSAAILRDTSDPSTIVSKLLIDPNELKLRTSGSGSSGLTNSTRIMKPLRLHYTDTGGVARFTVALASPKCDDTDTGSDTADDLRIGGGGGSLILCTFYSFKGDFLICQKPDASYIKVAIHDTMRETLSAETPDDFEITYDAWNRAYQTRNATMNGVTLTQAIRPKYQPGDLIWAMAASTKAFYDEEGEPTVEEAEGAIEVPYISVCDPRTYCTMSQFYNTT